MTTRRHVIVGNGGAAVSAIAAIRHLAPKDEIVSISREDCPAYSPVLTVYYLSGRIPYRGMFICNRDFYRSHRVTTRWGQAANAVDPVRREVRLADGTGLSYDTLLVSTGSTPMVPRISGVDLPGVFTLWTAQDARRLKQGVARARRVVVVGAGMIGMQVINALIAMGKQVVVVELLERPAALVLDEAASALIGQRLAQVPTELHFGERVLEIAQEKQGKLVRLSSGKEVRADAVVLSTGVRPNVELVRRSGIALGQGILVDEACRTTVEGAYAAGDVAESADAISGRGAIQATWPNAIEQGAVAGANMAGAPASRLRWCRSNVFQVQGLACASLGTIDAAGDGWSQQTTQSGDRYRKLVYRDDRLAGAVLVGDVSEAGALLGLIEKGTAGDLAQAPEGGWVVLAQPLGTRWP